MSTCKSKDHLPNNFVCPSSIIAQALDTVTNIEVPTKPCQSLTSLRGPALLPGYLDWFSVVETLDFCEDLLISFDEVSELVQQARPLETRDVFAPGSVESIAGSGDSDVDVFLRPLSLIGGIRRG